MAKLKLTLANIKALSPVAKPTYYFDTEVTGFFMREMPSGARTFGVEYRKGHGRGSEKGRHTIGQLGKVTPEQARQEAKKVVASVTMGGDPHGAKAAKSRELTVAGLIDLYEAEGCYVQNGAGKGKPLKAQTKQYTLARLHHHAIPLLGSRKLSSVTVEDLERFYHDVSAGKTAKDVVTGPRRRVIVKGGPGAARKVFRDLSAVFSFAENRRLIEKNLCTLANVRKTDNSNERFLSADEIERLGAALKSLSSEGANPKAVNIIYLWLFTGCRRNEISALKWSEVDLTLSQINLGDTKTGKSSRPLVPQAARILLSIQREGASEYVFPSERSNTYYQGTRKVLAEAIRRADIPGVTPHTLRHTIGAHAASAGTSMPMLGAMLGHKNARSTAIYAHVELNPVTRVMTDVVESFAHLVEDHSSPEAC